ncbi:hypothetical protein [Pelagibius sp.]|uniref:hypothetical protein n=1 Tax=Pelagibius sp. TaxID=1931238 RepID=UPI003B50E641
MSDRFLAVLLALCLVLPLGLNLDGELFGPDDAVSPGAELESLLNSPDAQPPARQVIVIAPDHFDGDRAVDGSVPVSVEDTAPASPWGAYPIDATSLGHTEP